MGKRTRTRQDERKANRKPSGDFTIVTSVPFKLLLVLLSIGLITQLTWVWNQTVLTAKDSPSVASEEEGVALQDTNLRQRPDNQQQQEQKQQKQQASEPQPMEILPESLVKRVAANPNDQPPHFFPRLPYLMSPKGDINTAASIPNADQLIADTLSGERPTLAGIGLQLQRFISELHMSHKALKEQIALNKADRTSVVGNYFKLAKQYLLPLDKAYRGRSIFPIREDGSIFISLASFRDHLLGETLKLAYRHAAHPERLYVGAVIQNCFGVEATCRTGVEVVGKDPKTGRDMTQVSDAPPDLNGVELFCAEEEFRHYCDNGQVRAIYVHDTEATGPAVARYMASKLWAGESWYVQVDAHLEFAQDWDDKYIAEAEASEKYPKVVLSAYPPGFQPDKHSTGTIHESPGAKLCRCEFSHSDVENHIIRINVGSSYKQNYDGPPTQIPFIAAGFFFAKADFLVDVPFDPFLPWCFMGEEIALSTRAWTSGWTIYAPRKNLIAHQYRPGRLGLPKFWESVGRAFGRPGAGFNTRLQLLVIPRIKHMVGYPEVTREQVISDNGNDEVLTELEYYGMGKERTLQEYLEWTNIDMEQKTCKQIKWCNQGSLT